MHQVAPISYRSICYEVQQQTGLICVTSTKPPCLGSRCTQPVMGRSGPSCLLTSHHIGQSGDKVTGLPLQVNHPRCSRVAQHALVLGSSGHVKPDSSVLVQPAQSTNSAF